MGFIRGFLGGRFRRLIFLAGLAATMGAAWGNITAYEVLSGSEFGVIDLGSGAFTYIGNSGEQLAGLGVFGGALYGGLAYIDSKGGGNTLYQINVATGALTAVGDGSALFNDFGSTLSGLYGIDTDGNLYTVDPSTGADTLVGATGLGAPSSTVGLSTNSNTLYYSFGGNLYTLSTSTGAATLVGALGTSQDGAMVYAGGSLYAGINSPLSIDTLNTSTGAATSGPAVAGTVEAFWGLAPDSVSVSSTPEPATFGLLVAAGAMLALRGRVSRKSPSEGAE
jgi:hypothetical protein